jgi:hypothetical protein
MGPGRTESAIDVNNRNNKIITLHQAAARKSLGIGPAGLSSRSAAMADIFGIGENQSFFIPLRNLYGLDPFVK